MKRQVCNLPEQLYKPIDKKWGYWFKNTKGFGKAIFTVIAEHCQFFRNDRNYQEGKSTPSCYK